MSASASPSSLKGKESNGTTSKRRAVACKSCHSLKVKCIPSDPHDLSSPCVRCIKSKRPCEIDLLNSRKRKRPEDRVTELEMKVEKLSHQLKTQASEDQSPMSNSSDGNSSSKVSVNKDFNTFTQDSYKQVHDSKATDKNNKHYEGGLKFVIENAKFKGTPPPVTQANPEYFNQQKSKRSKEEEIEEIFGKNILNEISNCVTATSESRLRKVVIPTTDFIAIGLLTIEEAKIRFGLFQNEIYARYPFVKVNSDFETVRKNEPLLFNAVMTVSGIAQEAKGPDDVKRDIELESITLRECINEFLIVGNKSIELLKCLLLLSVWYNTPELFHHRRYHIISSLCITMVQDLGLTGRPYYVVNKSEGSFKRSAVLEDPQKDEYRCLVLGVYCASIGYSLFLRRRLQVSWSPYMEECYQHMKGSPDLKIATMAKFAKISSFLERIHLHVDTKDQENPALIEYLLYEVNQFKNDTDMTIPQDVLMSFIHSIEAFLYSRLTTPEYCFKCLQACVDSLNCFSKLSPDEITKCPLLIFGRLMYCFALLLKTTNTLGLNFNVESIKGLMGPLKECGTKYKKNHMIIKIRLLFYFYLTTFAKNEDAFNNLSELSSTDAVARSVAAHIGNGQQPQPRSESASASQPQPQPQPQHQQQHQHQQPQPQPQQGNHPLQQQGPPLQGHTPGDNGNHGSQRMSFSMGNGLTNLLNVQDIHNPSTHAPPPVPQQHHHHQPYNIANQHINHNVNEGITWNSGYTNTNGTIHQNTFFDPIPELNVEPVYPRLDMLSDATMKGFDLNDFTSPQSEFWKKFDYKDDNFFL